MRLLILGGTQFVGRHLTEEALKRGYEVTLFNRGQRNSDLYPEVEKLKGDRDGNLESLKGRTWDAVIDVSGYVPRHVHDSATLLADAVEQYTFVSTISVYDDPIYKGQDENGHLGTLPPELEGTEQVTGQSYGPLKVLAEQAAEAAMPGRVLTVRPCVVVGPYDPTDRFTYWVMRFADPERNRVVVPAELDQPVQIIDGRDLARWTLDMTEQRKTGIYNTLGPDYPMTYGEMVDTCREVGGQNSEIVKVPAEELLAGGAQPWSDLPFWLTGDDVNMATLSNKKAVAGGLTFLPLRQIVEDTLAWRKTLELPLRAGWSYERESQFLQ